jgi:hypothetical protein
VQQGKDNLYIPDGMSSAAAHFAKNLYDNEVSYTCVPDGGSLRIGLRARVANSAYWVCFDNFRLFYYGSIPLDVVTGIDSQPLAEGKRAETTAIYNLNGQKVSTSQHLNTSSLPKGIYIVNGKKVVVK